MTKIATGYIALKAEVDDLKRDLSKAQSELERSTQVMQGQAVKTGKSFKAMWLAYAAGAAVVAATAMKAIKAASDLQETTSKFNVVFKGQQQLAESWAKTLVDGYAMSTRESKAYLSSVQDLLVPMGMASQEAGKLSFEIVKLAADLGSFNNLPTEQVMLDMQSALVGNFETMKKYGVVLNATVVQQKAMEMGLAATKSELTAGMKAQAAYALMVEGSQAAIGDMERTSDSYANTVKQAQAAWEDLMASLGELILPVATKVVGGIASIIKELNRLLDTMDDIMLAEDPFGAGTMGESGDVIAEALGPGGSVGGGGGTLTVPPGDAAAAKKAAEEAVKATQEAIEAIALADAEAKENLIQAQIDHDAAMAEFRENRTATVLAAFQEEADRILEIETKKASALGELETYNTEDFWTRTQEKYERLQELRDADLISEEQYQTALAALNRQTTSSVLGMWAQTFNTLAQIHGKHQKEFFRLYQAAAIARAVVSGVEAAVHAWNAGMSVGGPWAPAVAAAYAATSIAWTGAQIAAIASQSPPGSPPSVSATSPAGPGGTTLLPDEGQQQGQNQVNIYIQGDVLADELYIEMLAEKISEAVEGSEVRLIASETRAT